MLIETNAARAVIKLIFHPTCGNRNAPCKHNNDQRQQRDRLIEITIAVSGMSSIVKIVYRPFTNLSLLHVRGLRKIIYWGIINIGSLALGVWIECAVGETVCITRVMHII